MKNSSPPVNLNINTNQVYTIDGSQLNAFQGRYMISVTDEGNNIQNYYLVINKNTQLAPNHFWNTNYGQWFLNFAKLNGYDSTLIEKMNNIQVNNLIVESSSWTKKLATNKEIDVFLSKYLQNNLKIILQKKQTISYTDLLNQIQKLIPNTLLIPNESTFTYNNKLVKISIKKITNNFNNSQNENYKAGDEFEVDSTYDNQPMQKFNYKIKEQKESFHFSYNYLWIILAIIFILSISSLFIYYRHSKKYKLFVFKRNNIKRK